MASRRSLILLLSSFFVLSSCRKGSVSYDWYIRKCHIDDLWERPKRNDMTVAVLDSGFDDSYRKYFGDNLLPGYDFVDGDGDVSSSINMHGTYISLLIGARRSDEICGIYSRISVLPVRVIGDDGTTTEDRIVDGIEYAIANGAEVINMSFGSSKEYPQLKETIQENHDKAVFVAAAGDLSSSSFLYPAQWDGVLAVRAGDADGNPYEYSDSSDRKSVLAPGVNLKGPVIRDSHTYLTRLDGSSYATAIASGVVASYLLSSDRKPVEFDSAMFCQDGLLDASLLS